ncbi:MAG: hypothetical protein ACYTXC_23995 [Nostoc sp.]
MGHWLFSVLPLLLISANGLRNLIKDWSKILVLPNLRDVYDGLRLCKVVQFVLIVKDTTASHNFLHLAMFAAFFYLCN